MLQKVLVIVAAAAIIVFCLSGCKKRSSEPEPGGEVPKTMADYEAEAEREINKENMAEELEKIERAIKSEMRLER